MCCLGHASYLRIFPRTYSNLIGLFRTPPTRSKVCLTRATTSLFVSSPFFSSYTKWLALPLHVRQAKSLPSFHFAILQSSISTFPFNSQYTCLVLVVSRRLYCSLSSVIYHCIGAPPHFLYFLSTPWLANVPSSSILALIQLYPLECVIIKNTESSVKLSRLSGKSIFRTNR